MSQTEVHAVDALKSYIASKIILMSQSDKVFNQKDFVSTLGQISDYVSIIEDQFQDTFDELRGVTA